jgi:hypothetical protein
MIILRQWGSMDNIRSMMSAAGVFAPDEFANVLSVYKEIAAEPWFTRSPEKQQAFARHILNSYRSGTQPIEQFRLSCLAAAKVRFSEATGSYLTMEQKFWSPDKAPIGPVHATVR